MSRYFILLLACFFLLSSIEGHEPELTYERLTSREVADCLGVPEKQQSQFFSSMKDVYWLKLHVRGLKRGQCCLVEVENLKGTALMGARVRQPDTGSWPLWKPSFQKEETYNFIAPLTKFMKGEPLYVKMFRQEDGVEIDRIAVVPNPLEVEGRDNAVISLMMTADDATTYSLMVEGMTPNSKGLLVTSYGKQTTKSDIQFDENGEYFAFLKPQALDHEGCNASVSVTDVAGEQKLTLPYKWGSAAFSHSKKN